MKCEEHYNEDVNWNIVSSNCEHGIDFGMTINLTIKKLPTLGEVISYTLNMYQTDKGHKETILNNSTLDLMNHWIYCNVYTMTYTTIRKKIAGYLTEYHKVRDYDKKKRKTTYWERVQKFVNSCKAI